MVFRKSQGEESPVSQPLPQHFLCLFWMAAGPLVETGCLKVDGWFWNIYSRAGKGGMFASLRISLLNSARRYEKIHWMVYHFKLCKLTSNQLIFQWNAWQCGNKQTCSKGCLQKSFKGVHIWGPLETFGCHTKSNRQPRTAAVFYVLLSDRIYQQWLQWISGESCHLTATRSQIHFLPVIHTTLFLTEYKYRYRVCTELKLQHYTMTLKTVFI